MSSKQGNCYPGSMLPYLPA